MFPILCIIRDPMLAYIPYIIIVSIPMYVFSIGRYTYLIIRVPRILKIAERTPDKRSLKNTLPYGCRVFGVSTWIGAYGTPGT